MNLFGESTETKRADPQAGRKRNEARYRGSGRHWETPWDLFNRLDEEFAFSLDPCATADSAKCQAFYTETDDGLAKNWAGERVFMNPPYGAELPLWTRKARESAERDGALVVGLLPASTDTKWFHDDVLAAKAEIRYLRGRVRFKVGETWASPFQPTIIVVWRNRISETTVQLYQLGAESVHSGKLNDADKSGAASPELLPTQRDPKEPPK